MTRVTLLAAALILAVMPARAEPLVVITVDDCRHIVAHEPSDDVTYTPGVDVHGRPVAPADLNGGIKIEPPKEFSIPVTVDLQKRFGLPLDPNAFQMEAQIGNIVYRDGRAWFNGQPLPLENEAEIVRVCKELLAKRR